MNGWERTLLVIVWIGAFAPFLLLREVRTSLLGSAVMWIVALPAFLWVYMAVVGELRLHRLLWTARVWRAMRRDELVVHFQPIGDLASGRILKAEALVRWPRAGLMRPLEDWLPHIADTWIAAPFDLHVLELALAQARGWRDAGHEIGISVNCSPRCLDEPSFADEVLDRLEKWRIPPAALHVEITELASSATGNIEHTVARLRRCGVHLAQDDFGVVHSSLARVASLPIDVLKVDRSLVTELRDDPRKLAVVHAATDLAHSLGAIAVAEGVEDEETLHLVRDLGCDAVQGFYLSRPLAAERVVRFIETAEIPRDRRSGPYDRRRTGRPATQEQLDRRRGPEDRRRRDVRSGTMMAPAPERAAVGAAPNGSPGALWPA